MTDRELLELAAKAAGLNVKAQSVNADDRWLGFIVGEKHTKERKFWNPLIDDGDALRLAVKLRMDLLFDDKTIEVNATYHPNDETIFPWAWESIEPDVYAATRRAIVRAAAAIGKTMGEQA